MVNWIFSALFLLFSTTGFAIDVAPGGVSSGRNLVYSQEACETSFQELNCTALENDEDIKPYVRKCTEKVPSTEFSAAAKACLTSGAGAWGEVLQSLQEAPQAIAYGIAEDLKKQAQPAVSLNKFLRSCLKDMGCKSNLFRVGNGRAANEKENLDLASYENSWFPAPYSKIEALWLKAAAKQNTKGVPRDPWMDQKTAEIFGPPTKNEIHPNLLARAKDFIQSRQNKFQCLNAEGQAQMICYGVFSVLDPALAYSAAVKVPRLAKLIQATKGTLGPKLSEGIKKAKDAIEKAQKAPEFIEMKKDYAGETIGESRLGAAKVKYLETPIERAPYIAKPQNGKLVRQNGESFGPWDPSTSVSPLTKKARAGQPIEGAIFVLNEGDQLLINPGARVGKFHHSSFMAGNRVRGAGEMSFSSEGKITKISNQSGHYQPSEQQLNETIRRLRAQGYELREKHRYYPPNDPGVVIVEFY